MATNILGHPGKDEARQKIMQVITRVNRNNRPENYQIGRLVLDIHPGDTTTKTLEKWERASYAMYLAEDGESPERVAPIILARANELQTCVRGHFADGTTLYASPGETVEIILSRMENPQFFSQQCETVPTDKDSFFI